jgi:hypothetical protein
LLLVGRVLRLVPVVELMLLPCMVLEGSLVVLLEPMVLALVQRG